MVRRVCGFLLVVLTWTVVSAASAVEPLRVAGDRPIDIRHIRLDLRVDLPNKTVDARATLQLRSLRPISSIALDAADLEVKGVTLAAGDKDGASLPFTQDGGKLIMDLDPSWPADRKGTLRIDYRVRDPRTGLHFFGPTPAEPDVPFMVWSQGEAVTNHYWFPCLDQPNQRQTTELVVTVADGFEALSNGELVERRPNPADRTVTFHWRQEKPHVAYLVTLVVGQFDVVREEWNGLPLLYYVPRGRKEDVARNFGRTREMLTFFSRRFGIDYPWSKYAQVVVEQFTGGGMENTSATTLSDRALHDARASLDSTPDGLLAHEMAHQWWGDLVTCRDWAHLWLNEGFASFAEVLWAEHHDGADEGAYHLFQKARAAMAGDKDRPVVDRHYPSPDSMFDARAYPKGAWVLHMLRRRLGEDAFWKCVQRYGTDYRLQSADTTDFRKVLERETGRNLERFFYDWTERPGHPILEVTTEYLPDTKQARVAVKQTQKGEAFHLPLKIAFTCPLTLAHGVAGAAGSAPPVARPVVVETEISEQEHVFFVALPGRPTMVEVDPEQTVLAEIQENKARELWLAQLQEGGLSARIRAAQHLGQSKTVQDREVLARALGSEKFWGVQAEIAAALAESGGKTCREALVQGLQHSHPKVRRACAEQLGKFHRDAKAAAALRALLEKGDASYFVEAAALGAYAHVQPADAVKVLTPWLAKPSYNEVLRTAALTGLGIAQDLSALDTLLAWTKSGRPRQCRAAALLALPHLAHTANPSEAQEQQMVAALRACLDGETPLIRRTAVTALRDLGQSATPAEAALEALARHDPDERIRDLATHAIEQIHAHTPVPAEFVRLREALERIKKSNDTLRERLDRFEKVERKGNNGVQNEDPKR